MPVPKPSSACLPVFFRKTDACVLDAENWDLLKEMNPQVGKKLRVIGTSPTFVEGLNCVQVNHKEFRDDLLKALLELHADPQGAQLLLVFRSPKLLPADPQLLQGVRELYTRYLSFASPGERNP